MIVIRLMGGLGNQMFQYALGRRLALERGTALKLDLGALTQDKDRAYRLQHLAIDAGIANAAEILQAKGGAGLAGKLTRRLDALKPWYRRHWVVERDPRWEPGIVSGITPVYLEGYWQREEYFATIAPSLRKELQLRDVPSHASQRVAAHMNSVNAVSLHVRRGDYVTNPATQALYGVLPAQYYQAAALLMGERVERPHFFAFSDQPAWVAENLHLDYPMTCVTHNGAERDYEDLWLMTHCKHHIVANSSFSWWGAWLSRHPGACVVAPAPWYQAPSWRAVDPAPRDWIRIKRALD